MIEFIWGIIARILATNTVRNALIEYALRTPYYHLDDYVLRYWVTPRWMLGQDDQGHLFPRSWVPYFLRCRLHIYLAPDPLDYLHDHPANSRSVVLAGFVEEEFYGGIRRKLGRGQTAHRPAYQLHRVSGVAPGVTTTLWFRGHSYNKWGYLKNGKKEFANDGQRLS